MRLALDVAATEFYSAEAKIYEIDGKKIDSAKMVDLLAGWADKYPICSIEDGCSEDDWDGWKLLTQRLGSKVQLVGDDLFVTNTERLKRGIKEGIANSILIKVNQIGTLTETIDAIELARRARLHEHRQPSQRRDGRHDDRRPGRGAGHRADQDRLRQPHRPHRASTTNCCGSKNPWATRPNTPAGCFPNDVKMNFHGSLRHQFCAACRLAASFPGNGGP